MIEEELIKKIVFEYEEEKINMDALSRKYNIKKHIIRAIIYKYVKNIRKVARVTDYSKLTKENLYDLYIVKQMSQREICKYLSIGSGKVLRKKLKEHGIPTNNFRRRTTHWQEYEEISGYYWSSLSRAAKKRNFEFTITIEYAWDLFLKQNRKCALSGLDMKFVDYRAVKDRIKLNYFDSLQTASLDRIDSNLGYVEGNVQWLHKMVNLMKSDYNELYFINTCILISNHHLKNNSLGI